METDKFICLEIGCGKGDFICAMAQKFPDSIFMGVERIPDAVVSAMEKAKGLNLPNLNFIICDAKGLEDYFPGGAIDVIHLNFSDPWPKRYQHNKRLSSPVFLDVYKKIMKPGGKIILKTDNRDLFGYSLKILPQNRFEIKNKTYDLYGSEFLNGNIQTEYEKRFVSHGIKICYLEASLL